MNMKEREALLELIEAKIVTALTGISGSSSSESDLNASKAVCKLMKARYMLQMEARIEQEEGEYAAL